MQTSNLISPHQWGESLRHALFAGGPTANLAELAAVLHHARNLEGDAATQFIHAAIPICQQLNMLARAFDALPVARILPMLAERQIDPRLRWQCANTAGVVFGYTGDYESAIAQHGSAIRMAEETNNLLDQARSWNNLGTVFKYASAHDFAIECLSRAFSFIQLGPVFPRYCALANLSHCHLHLDNLNMGRAAAKLALKYESSEFRAKDPQLAVVLRGNYVRLLVASGRVGKTEELIAEADKLAEAHPAPLMSIATATMSAARDIAIGNVGVGIDRLAAALEKARKIPDACADSLIAIAHAEKIAGRPGRAVVYLHELSEHIYRHASAQAKRHLQLATWFDESTRSAEDRIAGELKSLRGPWGNMPEWDTFEKLAYSASLSAHGDGWHGTRVGAFSRLFALECGYDGEFANEIGLAARLHDIGHIGVPDALHYKHGSLSVAETLLMQKHASYGRDLLSCNQHPRALLAMHIAHYHHEQWNGAGYPAQLRGEAIPRSARIVAIADAFDDMVTSRFYRPTLPIEAACKNLHDDGGQHFDPALVKLFIHSVNNGLIGHNLRKPGWLQSMCPLNVKDLLDRVSRP